MIKPLFLSWADNVMREQSKD